MHFLWNINDEHCNYAYNKKIKKHKAHSVFTIQWKWMVTDAVELQKWQSTNYYKRNYLGSLECL